MLATLIVRKIIELVDVSCVEKNRGIVLDGSQRLLPCIGLIERGHHCIDSSIGFVERWDDPAIAEELAALQGVARRQHPCAELCHVSVVVEMGYDLCQGGGVGGLLKNSGKCNRILVFAGQ